MQLRSGAVAVEYRKAIKQKRVPVVVEMADESDSSSFPDDEGEEGTSQINESVQASIHRDLSTRDTSQRENKHRSDESDHSETSIKSIEPVKQNRSVVDWRRLAYTLLLVTGAGVIILVNLQWLVGYITRQYDRFVGDFGDMAGIITTALIVIAMCMIAFTNRGIFNPRIQPHQKDTVQIGRASCRERVSSPV